MNKENINILDLFQLIQQNLQNRTFPQKKTAQLLYQIW